MWNIVALSNTCDTLSQIVTTTNFRSVRQGSLPSACDKECKTFVWTDPALTSNEQQGSTQKQASN